MPEVLVAIRGLSTRATAEGDTWTTAAMAQANITSFNWDITTFDKSAGGTLSVTANFNEVMSSAPTLSISGLVTNTAMAATGDSSIWTFSINIASLGPPSSGDYLVTVGGSDLVGNTYTASGGSEDGDETEVDGITFTVDSLNPSVYADGYSVY